MEPKDFDLSEREQEILRLVATGASNKQIAQQLVISTNTVKVHLRNIFGKIGVASRTEATLYAIREGVVKTPSGQESLYKTLNDVTKEGGVSDVAAVAKPTAEIGKYRRGWTQITIYGLVFIFFLGGLGLALKQWLAPQASLPQSTPQPRWQLLAPMPNARSGLAAAVYADQIFAIGGESKAGVSGEVDIYNAVSNNWKILGQKTTPVADTSASVIGGKIYIPGGRLASGKTTDLLEVYNPLTHQWEERARLPIPLSGYASATLDGKIYLFGGWDGTKYLSSVFEYDPDIDVWIQKEDMPHARAYAGAAAAAGKIFVIGGFDGVSALAYNEEFSPDVNDRSEKAWISRTPLPEARYGMGVASFLDLIYVIGGEGLSKQISDSSLQYLVAQNVWNEFENPKRAIGANLAVATQNTMLYTIGGKINGSPISDTQSYQALYTILLPISSK